MKVLLNIYNKMYEYICFICFKNIRMNYNHISILHYLKSWACISPHATLIVFSLYNENALQLMFSLIYYEWEKHLALLPNNEWQLISHYSWHKLSRSLCTWFCHAQLKLWLTFAREDAQCCDEERDITEGHVSLIRDLVRGECVRRRAEVSSRSSEGRCLHWARLKCGEMRGRGLVGCALNDTRAATAHETRYLAKYSRTVLKWT